MPVPRLLLATLSSVLAAASFAADVAYSPPVGGMTINVTAGTVAAPFTTSFAMTLLDVPAASGTTVGQVSSVTATTVSVTGASWTSGALALSGFPYAIRFTGGSAAGLSATITGNTADTVTVSGVDLVQLGVVSGDAFMLVPIDTLSSFFGSSTLLGGPTVSDADVVTISANAQISYYYNTTLNRWVRTTGPTTDRGGTPIPLDSVVSVTRKGVQLALTVTGRVPTSRAMIPIANAGNTFTHTGFPTDVTISALSAQTRIPGWVSSATASGSDLLGVNNGGFWTYYFHNGSFWQRTTGPATNRDSVVVPAGAAIRYFKQGAASGISYFTRAVPFTL